MQDESKTNKSRVTITADPFEDSPSGNVTQVTVVTTHPPILLPPMESSTPVKPPSSSTVMVKTPADAGSEVIIVANETNKTQINESSTDEDNYDLLDSLNYVEQPINIVKGKKLDESEVLIVSPSFVDVDDSDRYVVLIYTM